MEAATRPEALTPRAAALWLAVLVAVTTAVRIAWAAGVELAPDEAYYWTWSLQLGTLTRDHPPGIAWLIRLGTSLLGDSTLGVRSGSLVCAATNTVVVYHIARDVLGDDERGAGDPRRWALLCATLTTLGLLGSVAAVVHTPDAGLSLAWSLALLGIVRAVRTGVPGGLYVAGLATAAGILFKLTMVLLPVCALAALLSARAGRRLLRTPHPYLAASVAMAPVIWILASSPALGFQWQRALSRPGGLVAALELLGAQVALMTPLVAIAVAVFVGSNRWRATPLWWATVIPLGFFLLVALWTRPEANWPAVAHIAATIGAVQWARRRVSRLWRMLGLGTAVAASLAVHCQVLMPLIPLHPERDPTARLSGWTPLGTKWGRIRDAAGETAACADHYGLAAELQFYDPAHRPVSVCTRSAGTPLPPGLFASAGQACNTPRRLRGDRPPRAPRILFVSECVPGELARSVAGGI